MTVHRNKIDEMIAATDDQKDRAILMVLSAIDNALERNTEATRQIAEEMKDHRTQFSEHREHFDAHIMDEQKILAGVKWGWWSATVMGAIILTLGGYLLTTQLKSIESDSQHLRDFAVRIGVIESQLFDLRRAQ
jgi:hypothetical protein